MLVGAVVCPHPPALVPAVSHGAAGVLHEMRVCCLRAVVGLRNAQPEVLICVGAGPVTSYDGAAAGGDLRRYGVDAAFGSGAPVLPLSLTVGRYLLETAGVAADGFQTVAASASPEECRTIGAALVTRERRVALLVMGDGSAKRMRTSPGYLDRRAEAFDSAALRALKEPDPAALLAIDTDLAADLWVAGCAPWQVLAGAIAASPAPWSTRVAFAGTPLGVGAFVVELHPGQELARRRTDLLE